LIVHVATQNFATNQFIDENDVYLTTKRRHLSAAILGFRCGIEVPVTRSGP
jgi:hypothetical protein